MASEEGGGVMAVQAEEEMEEDVELHLAELIDRLADKK